MKLVNSFAYLSHPACLQHEMGEFHPESPDRVRAIEERLIACGLLAQANQPPAPLATAEQIGRAHPKEHFLRLQALAPSQGYAAIDPDTTMNPHTWQAALRAAGAVVQATETVWSNPGRRAFCNVRPPGHHAEPSRSMGFCFFNNVAIGIRHALEALGAKRVALVDFDVHHGNGSENIFAGDERVLMLSTFQSPLYPHSGEHPLADNMVNIPLRPHTDGGALRQAFEKYLKPAFERFEPEMLFISAGFDAHEEDPLSQLRWRDADYGWITREWVALSDKYCEGRIVSVLEGGYALDALARSAEIHVRELIGRG